MMSKVVFCSFFSFFFLFCISGIADDANQRVIERYRELLSKSPKQGAVFDRVYEFYADTGQTALFYQESLSAAQQSATQNDPAEAGEWMLVGLIADRQSRWDAAAEAFQKTAALEPDNFLPMLYLGEVLLKQRRMPDAVTTLEEAKKRLENQSASKNDLRRILQALALAYIQSGNPQQSSEMWNQLVNLFPDDPDPLVHAAESMESADRLDAAIQFYRQAVTMIDDPAERVRLSLAIINLMIRQGKNETAWVDLNALLNSLDMESYLAESVRIRMDQFFEQSGDIPRQIEFYQNRIKQNPNDVASRLRLVQVFKENDRIADAETLLLDSVKAFPSDVSIRLTLVDIFTEQGKMGSVLEQYQAMDKISPLPADLLLRWAELIISQPNDHENRKEKDKRSEAIQIMDRITRNSPNDPMVAVQVADFFAQHQFLDVAEQSYQKAMILRPKEFSFRESLATFYHQQGKKEKVLETLSPEQTQAFKAETGQLLLSLGYADESLTMLESAAQESPHHWRVQYQYFDALLQRNTPESFLEAIKLLRAVEKNILEDEQFAAFMQQEVPLLKSIGKVAELAGMLQTLAETEPSVRLYWHLAILFQAEADFSSAATSVEKALDINLASPNSTNLSLPLRRLAAEVYEQAGQIEKSITLYQTLAKDDLALSSEHWMRIVSLQLRQGTMHVALESSQNLLGRGRENAERLLFVADLFLTAQRHDEAIKLLQQALMYEQNNTDVLRLLAQTLADTGQHHEAVEMYWQFYDKLEYFPAQLSVIEILSNEYHLLGKSGELIERLRQLSRKKEKHRIALQSLVRVYTLQNNTEEALDLLEDLLGLPEDHLPNGHLSKDKESEAEFGSHWVLRELVNLSEKRRDFVSAIQYQEMLCERLTDLQEQNHLFFLYDKLGDKEKTKQLFFDQVIRQGTMQKKLELVDTMIRQEEYDRVSQVLDFLSIHEPEHWGVLFRQILIAGYQNQSTENLVKAFRAKSFPQEIHQADSITPSLERQNLFLKELFQPHSTLFSIADISSFEEARFLSTGFLLKESLDKDRALNDEQSDMPHFRIAVEEFRDEFPLDSDNTDVLFARLRLEVWLLQLFHSTDQRSVFSVNQAELPIDTRQCRLNIVQVFHKFPAADIAAESAALLSILLSDDLNKLAADRFNATQASCNEIFASWQQTADDTFEVLDALKLQPSDRDNNLFTQPEPNISLARYRLELQGDRPIVRSIIDSLLINSSLRGQISHYRRLSEVEQLFYQILLLHQALSHQVGDADPLMQYLASKTQSSVESDRIWSTHLLVLLENWMKKEIPLQEQVFDSSPNAEFLRQSQLLESKQKEQPLTQSESLAHALLYLKLERYHDAVTVLDSMKLQDSTDLQIREWATARLAVQYALPDSPFAQRGNEAVTRLRGFPLSERDKLHLIPLLQFFHRTEEEQQIWDQLAASATERRFLMELFNQLASADEPQKENLEKVALRILYHSAFLQNPRRLPADVRLMVSTVEVLQKQNQTATIIPILEDKIKRLRSKADSKIVLAFLYQVLNRHEDTKKLGLELAENPVRESERRQMITTLLLDYQMENELKSMNKLLLEGRNVRE